jgi:superfamily I DNA/RNA helicase
MRNRVQVILNRPLGHNYIGTFHSICYRILKEENHLELLGFDNKKKLKKVDRHDGIKILKDIVSE